MQRQLLPQEENPLPLDPTPTLLSQRNEIELAQQGDYDHSHFDPCQAAATTQNVSQHVG
jgi:hypothetical protein